MFASETLEIEGTHVKGQIFAIDNFGNCKTTMLASDIKGKEKVKTSIGEIQAYD